MSRRETVVWLVLAAIVSVAVNAALSEEKGLGMGEEKAVLLPPVKEMVYSCGKDDESWLDMGSPYANSGKTELTSGQPYPAAIHGQLANYYAHTIDIRLQLEKPLDLVLVIDFLSEEGGKESTEELKVLLNGQLVQSLDLKPQSADHKKRYEVIDLPAEEGENIVTLDMSHNANWYNCWFDSILLYEPELGEGMEEGEL